MSNATTPDQGPYVDPIDILRRVSMVFVARGLDDIGVQMLEALRPQMREPADIDSSRALAEYARGDFVRARRRVEQDVLATQPTHAMSLLVKSACERAEGRENWQRSAQAVLSTSGAANLRSAALELLSA